VNSAKTTNHTKPDITATWGRCNLMTAADGIPRFRGENSKLWTIVFQIWPTSEHVAKFRRVPCGDHEDCVREKMNLNKIQWRSNLSIYFIFYLISIT